MVKGGSALTYNAVVEHSYDEAGNEWCSEGAAFVAGEDSGGCEGLLELCEGLPEGEGREEQEAGDQ